MLVGSIYFWDFRAPLDRCYGFDGNQPISLPGWEPHTSMIGGTGPSIRLASRKASGLYRPPGRYRTLKMKSFLLEVPKMR
jgi:hypothetical protein